MVATTYSPFSPVISWRERGSCVEREEKLGDDAVGVMDARVGEDRGQRFFGIG
jgi:hypothetical protein